MRAAIRLFSRVWQRPKRLRLRRLWQPAAEVAGSVPRLWGVEHAERGGGTDEAGGARTIHGQRRAHETRSRRRRSRRAPESTGLGEFDRVLGGGLVPGGVVLLGGDPGIGKSTLLLRALADLAPRVACCYVTGEESLDQIGLRAQRLGVGAGPAGAAGRDVRRDDPGARRRRKKLGVLAIDSIQTLFSAELQSAPGSVSQVRECAAQLVRYAKTHDVATLLVGHVTKEGTLAGPRVLEHMVDTVLYFESDLGSRFRIVRAVEEPLRRGERDGVLRDGRGGLSRGQESVGDLPRAARRSRAGQRHARDSRGYEARAGRGPGARRSHAGAVAATARARVRHAAAGLLLAVLHRHCGFASGDSDVFANIVGGLRVGETAADLASRWPWSRA